MLSSEHMSYWGDTKKKIDFNFQLLLTLRFTLLPIVAVAHYDQVKFTILFEKEKKFVLLQVKWF